MISPLPEFSLHGLGDKRLRKPLCLPEIHLQPPTPSSPLPKHAYWPQDLIIYVPVTICYVSGRPPVCKSDSPAKVTKRRQYGRATLGRPESIRPVAYHDWRRSVNTDIAGCPAGVTNILARGMHRLVKEAEDLGNRLVVSERRAEKLELALAMSAIEQGCQKQVINRLSDLNAALENREQGIREQMEETVQTMKRELEAQLQGFQELLSKQIQQQSKTARNIT